MARSRRQRETLVDRLFPVLQRYGLHVTRNHFYEPVPDTRLLSSQLWEQPSALIGIDLDEDGQLRLLDELVDRFGDEFDTFPSKPSADDPWGYHLDNPQFGSVDAHMLHGVVRSLRPARVIEVGSGWSTLVTAGALARNAAEDPGATGELIAIEPYPPEVLHRSGIHLDELLVKPVQEVPLATFERLGAGDILFIDSSHVLKVGSDVQYLFLEVVPRLAPGVWVHVHDCYLPWEYPRHLVVDWHRFWTEQYLLQAFLAFNSAFELRWSSHFVERSHRTRLEDAFRPVWPRASGLPPSSIWIERVR